MTHEEAKSELMQIYMSLSEEKKKAIDVLLSESEKPNKSEVLQNTQQFADGEYISKNNAITSVCQWGTTLERTGTYTITVAEMKQTITDMLCELPTVAIPNKTEPKTGHWIITYPHGKQNPIYECPHCHASNSSVFKNFCPNCGAKMVEERERSDKE